MADQKSNTFSSGYSALTHADISAFIGRTLTAGEQALVTSLILMAELHFCKQTNRNYLTTPNYIETVDAGRDEYFLSNFPIKELNSITLDGVAIYTKGGSSNTYNLNEDFFVYDDHIQFYSVPYSVNDNRRALVFSYALDTCFMADAKLALQEFVSNLFLAREEGGKEATSINAGGLSESFSDNVSDYFNKTVKAYRKFNI